MGTTALMSVPYALYDKSSGNTAVLDSVTFDSLSSTLTIFSNGDSVATELSFPSNNSSIDTLVLENDSILQIVEVMRTNARGSFDLRRTDPQANYKIILPDSFQIKKIMPYIYLVDRATQQVIKTQSVTFSIFKFFTPEAVESRLNENDLAYFNAPYEVNGQVFKKLPGDYTDGMSILVYDEDGNLVEEGLVDDDGNFSFKKLRPDRAYLFQPQVADKSEFQLVLYDQDDIASEYLRFGELQNYM